MTDWPEIDEDDRIDVVKPKPGRVQRFLHGLKVATGWMIAIPIIVVVVFVLSMAAIVWENWDSAKLSAPAPVWVVWFVALVILIALRQFAVRMEKQLDRLEEYERATQTRLDNIEMMVARLQLERAR